MKYSLKDFYYKLPDNLIATHPAKPRDHSRLLVLDKETGKIEHKHFYDIIDYLNKGDVLIMNNSKVIPARLMAEKAGTGGKVEVLLHKKINTDTWQCLLGGRVKEGLLLSFRPSAFSASGEISSEGKGSLGSVNTSLGMTGEYDFLEAEVVKDNKDGTWDIEFNKKGDILMEAIIRLGETPLPPYIENRRKQIKGKRVVAADKKDYQTIYAANKKAGSVAAPTAGLHFTKRLMDKIKRKGIKIEFITLYVGLGTFAPVKVDDPKKHKMHAEWVEIDQSAINNLQSSVRNKKRIVAVGTTACRALEACFSKITTPDPSLKRKGGFQEWVDIFIYPGYKFKVVDALITNFHLPKSTLLMLVSALAGKKNIDQAYKEAVKNKYRFYSYGDAMLIK